MAVGAMVLSSLSVIGMPGVCRQAGTPGRVKIRDGDFSLMWML
jgi:hypothetical protein